MFPNRRIRIKSSFISVMRWRSYRRWMNHSYLVFIDADKRLYSDYYDLIFDKLPAGPLILADNTLWDGKVLEPLHPADKQTAGILAFNDKIKADQRVEKVILPLWDGLTMIWKNNNYGKYKIK